MNVKEELRVIRNKLQYRFSERNNPGNYYSNKAFDYYKCIFIHIPKSGGLSIAKSLFGNFGAGHIPVAIYKNQYSEKRFNRYFKFTVVRNPFDRFYSAYSFLKKGGISRPDKIFHDKILKKFNSFEDFTIQFPKINEAQEFYHFIPQHTFICDENDTIQVDFVGRFETLRKDFKFIANQIGLAANLYRFNYTEGKETYASKFTDQMKQVVSDFYLKDFLLFNYSS